MAHDESLTDVASGESGDPGMTFTIDEVRELSGELGVSDDGQITQLMEQLTHMAIYRECTYEIFDRNPSNALVRKRLRLLEETAGKLLEQIEDLDHRSKEALAEGVRRCWRRDDPRVHHLDHQSMLGPWRAIRAMRNIVDLLREAMRCAIQDSPRGDGRPSRRSLNQAVLELAQTYEDFSGKKFKREKGRGVWSIGAEWVAKVTTMLTPKGACPPTRRELNTAMRYAARALGNGPRKYVWSDEALSDSDKLQKPPT